MRRATGVAIALSLAACTSAPGPAPSVISAPVPTAPRPPVRPDVEIAGPFNQGGIALGRAPSDAVALTLDGKPVDVASDGRFLIGFGRDAAASAELVVRRADGSTETRTLPVAPRSWRIENLASLPRVPRSSAEFERLRPLELEEIASARTVASGSQGWRQRFAWPVIGRISGLFGSQRIYRGEPGAYHSGVDVARPTGTPFFAPADGVVILATDRPFTLEGYLLMIDHGMGLNSAFLHLSRIDVKAGDVVTQGQMLGTIGASGRATGPHLHWGMKWRDERLDPLLVAGAMPGSN